MGKKSRRNRTSEAGNGRPTGTLKQPAPVSRVLLGLAVAVAIAGVYFIIHRSGPESGRPESAAGRQTGAESTAKHAFRPLLGKWMRPDGGYVISVRSVDRDGRVDAGYFNPRPINVSRAEASVQGNTVRLFIELQAAGYPGSTYELAYDPDNDVLVGIYFQAAMQQRFEVYFVRTE